MKKAWLIILFLTFAAHAQVLRLTPTSDPNGMTFTSLSASSNTSFTFTWPGTDFRNEYAGYCEVVVEVDSASGTVGDRDSLWASIQPLFGIKHISTGVFSLKPSSAADKDSIDIVNVYNWGTTDSDSKYDINATANLPPCDGARVNVYTGRNAQCKVRVFLKIQNARSTTL